MIPEEVITALIGLGSALLGWFARWLTTRGKNTEALKIMAEQASIIKESQRTMRGMENQIRMQQKEIARRSPYPLDRRGEEDDEPPE